MKKKEPNKSHTASQGPATINPGSPDFYIQSFLPTPKSSALAFREPPQQ